MNRAKRTLIVAASVVTLLAGAGLAQAPQGGGRAGAPSSGPGGRAGGGGRGAAPLMQTSPKPAIPNARAVRSCESLASVALPNTTI